MQRIDRYEIEKTLGVGTVGTIYQVKRQESDERFALKLLLPSVSSDPLIVNRFEREMVILSKLDHANIVSYHGNGRHEGQIYYVMELVHGGTLKEMLNRGGTFSWQEAAECGRQIAAALQHAHNHGIIHRDLKPGNVFLTESGEVKLGDFGIARDLHESDLTDAGLTVGTYAYMAPEIVKGSRQITGQVDLYALGCVLYELVAGHTPYQGDNFAAIFEQHLHADPPHLSATDPTVPAVFDKLIVDLLSKDPQKRPFNARSVQGILNELTDYRPPRLLSGRDRAAAAVRPVQASLVKRIQHLRTSNEVSWLTLSLVGIGLALFIGLAVVFSKF